MPTASSSVVLLGAGRMGAQIGCEYALGGRRVAWLARAPERARRSVEDAFALAVNAGLTTASAARDALATVTIAASIDELDADVDLVVESIVEDLDEKAAALRPLAAAWPGAVLASNTSSIEIARLGEAIGAPARTIGTHYWSPPLLMPMVEVIRGARTDAAVVDSVVAGLRALGKQPVVLDREAPGFLWNRLQFALLREALWLVEEGVATPEVVDEVVRSGLARRWRLAGPFETAALGGAQTFASIAANLFPKLSAATDPPVLDRWLIDDEDELATRRRRRDEALAQELRAERRER